MRLARTVLIADHHAAARYQLAEILKGAGASILAEVGQADDLMVKAERLRPDVLFLDVGLPGADTLVTIRQLRRTMPDLVVLVTCTPSEAQLAMAALTVGAAEFITKPFGHRTISDALSRYA